MVALDTITKYWEIILFVLAIVFNAIWAYFTIQEHEKRIVALETHSTDVNESIQDIQKQLGEMNTKLDILVEGYRR